MARIISPALGLAVVLALAGCGGGSEPPSATADAAVGFTDKAAFERYVSDWTVRKERERYGAELTVSNIDCIKTGESTAKCVIDGSTPLEGDVQLKADVVCQGSEGNCLIEVEPLR